jgi:formylglycine-generating enzyme required for sulfatase activity
MPDAGAGEKLKVFISYSRKDSAAFADELLAGLELAGFAPFLDRHDIAPGEKWEERLGSLIAQSDTVVFVVSPEAVRSKQCTWEVDRTLELSKRLLPVIFKSVPDHDIPEKLRRFQFVPFDSGFARPLSQLAEALRVDLQWIREHTRIGDLATRWDKEERPEWLLLRGNGIDEARRWMEARNTAAPEITDAQRAFLKASEEAESARLDREREQLKETVRQQRRIAWLLGGVAVLMGGIILGLIAWINESFIRKEWNSYLKEWPYWRANFKNYDLTVARERALKPGDSFRECAKDCPEMVVVPAGEFMMGSPDKEKGRKGNESPQHKVTIARPFAVSKFDLTFAEWDACVSVGECPQVGDSGYGRGIRPAINVSWKDAKQYVDWLSKMTGRRYRLLAEAEWEYAARAGSTSAYFWGDEIGKGNANCDGCSSPWDGQNQTAPVGSFAPNSFGLYEMAGNVWQWIEDCYHNYEGVPTDDSAWTVGDCNLRVIRGGSWFENPQVVRSAYRDRLSTDIRGRNIGFRVGRTLSVGAAPGAH